MAKLPWIVLLLILLPIGALAPAGATVVPVATPAQLRTAIDGMTSLYPNADRAESARLADGK